MYESDQQWVQKIREGDETAFEQLFFEYYNNLCAFALKITKSKEQARDVVQDIFLKLWNRRKDWKIDDSLKTYLYQAVWNQALNSVKTEKRHQKNKNEFAEEVKYFTGASSGNSHQNTTELITRIWEVTQEMPEQRQQVFILHRKHGLSYKEISKVMDITRKTVENHMGLALKYIREQIDREQID